MNHKHLILLILLGLTSAQLAYDQQLPPNSIQPPLTIDHDSHNLTEVLENKQSGKKNSQGHDSDEQNEDINDRKDKSHSHEIPGIGLGIVFIFGSLLYGSILKMISRSISIPCNPMLLISGIVLGMYHTEFGMLGQSIRLISTANPSGILAIFLPVLLFETAFKTEWHIFKKLAAQSLIMGILSTIVSATLIMLLVKLYLDHNNFYEWDEAFILGSLLSCTDILSFINRLKRAEAPQKVTSLLEGESIFNYCTCVLIVELMHYYNEAKQVAGFWEYLKLIIVEIGGGIFMGVAVGLIAVYCIKRMIYDGILVVTLMVIFTYSIYLFAEFSTYKISGITSVAVFALYMNAFGKTWLFGQTQQNVSSFWSYLVFVSETNIFIIAGVMVGSSLLHLNSNSTQINIYNELFYCFYIYLFTVLSRFLSMTVFIKYLKKLGEGLNWKEIILLTVAGLKGAIGIALAMQIFKSKDFGQIASYLIMIHVTSNSLITLIIHGTTAGLVVKLLDLSSLKKVQYKFFKEYLFSFKASIIERMQLMKERASEDNLIQWSQVQNQIGMSTYQSMSKKTENIITNKIFNDESMFQKSLMFKLQNIIKQHATDHEHEVGIEKELSQKNALFDLEVQFRKRFIKDLISKYWEFHDANETSPAALMLLIQSANYDLDRNAEEIESWAWIKNQISFNIKIYSELMKITLINELAKSSLFDYVTYCYDVVSSYIKANEEVREELSSFYQTNEHKSERDEGLILMNILNESEENQKQAQYFMANYLEPSFPQIEQQVKTRKVSFFILHTFKNIIDKNNENGQLEPNQFDMLNHIIDQKSLDLNLLSPKWEESDLFQILSENKEKNVFRSLPGPVLNLIASQLGEQFTFDANEVIIDNSQIAKYVFFVKKGGCTVEFTNQTMVYKEPMLAGQIFGFQSLLTNIYHSKATANTMAQILQLKKTLLEKIFDSFPSIQQAFWKNNIYQCYKMFLKKEDVSYRISHISKEIIENMFSTFTLKRFDPTVMENPQFDLIFIRGNVQLISKEEPPSASVGSYSYKKLSRDKDMVSAYIETVPPFYFFSRFTELTLRIKDTSLFLIGQLDYEVLQRQSMRLSRHTTMKKNKKDSVLT